MSYFHLKLNTTRTLFLKARKPHSKQIEHCYKSAHGAIRGTKSQEVIVHESMRAGYDLLRNLVNSDSSLTLFIFVDDSANNGKGVIHHCMTPCHLCIGMSVGSTRLKKGTKERIVDVDPRSYVFTGSPYTIDSITLTRLSAPYGYVGGRLQTVYTPAESRDANKVSRISLVESANDVTFEINNMEYSNDHCMYSYFYGTYETMRWLYPSDYMNLPNEMCCTFYKGDMDCTMKVQQYMKDNNTWFGDDPCFSFFWEML